MSSLTLNKLQAEYLRRAQTERLHFYEPYPKQLAYHKSQAEIRAFLAGNQAGKSFAGTVDNIWTATRTHPYRANYTGQVYVRDCCVSFGAIKSILVPIYKNLIPKNPGIINGMPYCGLRGSSWDKAYSEEDKTIYFADGSFIEFKTYEQGREAHQGTQRHKIRFDEEPPRDIYEENLARQITLKRNLDFTLTPLNYMQWFYADIYEASAADPRIEIFEASSYDNPYANHDVLRSIEATCTDPAIRAARIEGKLTFLAGRVYKDYGSHNLIDQRSIPRHWHRSVIIDPHPEKPTAVLWVAEDDEEIHYVYDEMQIYGDVEHIANSITARCAGQNIDLWLIDPSSLQAAAIRGKGSLVDEFRHYFSRLVLANNNRELGWESVRQRCHNRPGKGPRLYVMRNCPQFDFQMKNYSWKPPLRSGENRSKPDVVKRHDDLVDCYRYRSMWQGHAGHSEVPNFNIGIYANG